MQNALVGFYARHKGSLALFAVMALMLVVAGPASAQGSTPAVDVAPLVTGAISEVKLSLPTILAAVAGLVGISISIGWGLKLIRRAAK